MRLAADMLDRAALDEIRFVKPHLREDAMQEAWAAIAAGKNPVSAITRFRRQEAVYERRQHWWQVSEFRPDPDTLGATYSGPRHSGPRPVQKVFTLPMNVEYLYAIGPGGWRTLADYFASRPSLAPAGSTNPFPNSRSAVPPVSFYEIERM